VAAITHLLSPGQADPKWAEVNLMSNLEIYDAVNRDLWNQWTPIHAESAFYNVAGFRAGESTLKFLEREALGDVSGKSILHLQCHFGLDSLSLARAGAKVTGVDYSEKSIDFACALSEEMAIPARFIRCNVYELHAHLDEQFDIVFASYGVLHWLPDLSGFCRVVARYLKYGGIFFLVDFHPLFNMLDERGEEMVFPYFPATTPLVRIKKGSCVDPETNIEHEAYEWPHSMAEIVTACIDAGLRICEFAEYPFMVFHVLPYLEDIGYGRYAARRSGFPLPLMFSVRAAK
jgi:2-polyprenyl-3-methyl-5-hydroxy-6-metoxy-1,4-benzoquinol methylase